MTEDSLRSQQHSCSLRAAHSSPPLKGTGIPAPVIEQLFHSLGAKATAWAEKSFTDAAKRLTELGIRAATDTITNKPDLLNDLFQRSTGQAASGLAAAVATKEVQSQIANAGYDSTHAMLTGAEHAVNAHIEAAPNAIGANLLNSIANLLTRTPNPHR